MAISIKITKNQQSQINECDFENIVFGKLFSDHMFRIDYKDGQWQEAEILPYGPISFSPALASLHYGQAIFEGMKAYKDPNGNAQLFRPYDNHKRFNISAERMGMPQVPEDVFIEGLKALVDLDKDWIPVKHGSALYLRPFMFATDDFVGVRPSANYSFIIFCCPVNSYYPLPIKVKVETNFARAFQGGAGFAKAAGNYGISMQPTILAKKEGYDQIIWTDATEHAYVEESGTTNLFFVIDDKLVLTPELDGNILAGITRDSSIQLLRKEGYEVQERKISVNEIISAIHDGRLTDAFGTGTAAIIAKIATIAFQGKEYHLPNPEKRKVSNWLYKTIGDIQTSAISDDFNWVYKI